jgi:hypothetical protein
MSVLGKLQEDVAALVKDSVRLPAGIDVITREKGEILNDLEARISKLSLGVFVMPVLPKAPLAGAPFVFFSAAEVRVRVIENRKLNASGHDAYDLAEMVTVALQGSNPGDALSAPLEASDFEINEDASGIALDCIFRAALGVEA